MLSEQNRRSRDFTLNSLIHAIREIIACFPVYRTYVRPDPNEPVTDRDRAYIRLAVARAKRRNPALSNLVFDFIRELLTNIPTRRFDYRLGHSPSLRHEISTNHQPGHSQRRRRYRVFTNTIG